MKSITLALLLLSSAMSNAAVYEQTNNQNSIMYSDTPHGDSKPINPSEGSSLISAPLPQLNSTITKIENKNKPANQLYKTFAIISPKDQASTQGQADIPVRIKIEPELRKGDMIQILVDGKSFGSAAANLNPALNGVERGARQLSAVVIDANQQIIQQSNTLTLNVHRTSRQTSPAFAPPPSPLPK